MNPFKSPIEWLKELLISMIKESADAAFHWLKIFMLKPSDWDNFAYGNQLYNWILGASISLGILFFIYNLMKLQIQKMGGFSGRSISEITVKSIFGTLLALFSPFIFNDVLLKLNNVWVNFILDKGINVDTLADLFTVPATAGITVCLVALILAILFLILSIQYIIRTGELLALFILSALAAVTIVNEEMNIYPIWFRESISTIFQQAFQISILWVIFNSLADGKTLNDYIMSCSLCAILIIGPGFLRRFLYSTGSGKMLVNAAGGASKMAMIKFAASKFTK